MTLAMAQKTTRDGLWDAHNADYVLRLNYGVAATKTGAICVVEGYVPHTFHLGRTNGKWIKCMCGTHVSENDWCL